jgi:hypothetical protein
MVNQMKSSIPLVLAAWLVLAALTATAVAQSSGGDRPVDRAVITRLAKRIEPELKGTPDRLQQYVDFFRRESADDARLFAFAVKAEPAGEGVRLSGYVEFPETRNALVAFFETLGFELIDNQIETLPSAELGDDRYGFIKVANSLSYAEPEEEEVVTDCLLGEPLYLLRQEGDHFLLHGGDGYLGYVAAKDIERVDGEGFKNYLAGPRVSIRDDFKTYAGVALPAGGRLKFVRHDGDRVVAALPGGAEVILPASACDVREAPDDRIDRVCTSAEQLLGTEYLWGGKTSKGVDCSGLVQVSFSGVGVTMPRDANQQFQVGQLSATRWNRAGLRRGDTLYFINPQGKISHTGLYLGDDQFIHAVSPVVVVNSFNPQDKNYAPRQDASFAFARRLWD